MLAWSMNLGFAASPAGTPISSGDRRIYWPYTPRLGRYYVLLLTAAASLLEVLRK